MSVTAICGMNWGDEGKGRMVDYLATKADFVVRFQGGNNAGHTVINEYGKFALHLLPSGVFNKQACNIISNGVVVNPEALAEEIDTIEKSIKFKIKLLISERAHVVFPFHILLDTYEEERLEDKKFGSTKRGIAPVYSDKYSKIGIQVADLLNKDYLKSRLKSNLDIKNQIITKIYNKPAVNLDEMVEWAYSHGQKIKHYIGDTIQVLMNAVKENKNILLEGQLGALRDIDFGIYPYTTSSSPIPGYASAGTSIPTYEIKKVIGVTKAYSTCVGEGPFCTEITSEIAAHIREKGKEFGASTGRPRRIGWFDVLASKFGKEVSSVTDVALTLLDVLTGIKEIKIGVAYKYDGKAIKNFPTTQKLYNAEVKYITMPGWKEDITGVRKFEKLPVNAQKYVLKLEELLEAKIKYISVGPEREQLIIKK